MLPKVLKILIAIAFSKLVLSPELTQCIIKLEYTEKMLIVIFECWPFTTKKLIVNGQHSKITTKFTIKFFFSVVFNFWGFPASMKRVN
jgi:hypothetical protein